MSFSTSLSAFSSYYSEHPPLSIPDEGSDTDTDHSLENFSDASADADVLAPVLDAMTTIPIPGTLRDAASLLGAATTKRESCQLAKDLADSQVREARLQVTVFCMKAEHAAGKLEAADLYLSRIRLAIQKSHFGDILSHPPSVDNVVVKSDKAMHFVDTPDGPLYICLD